MILDLRPDGTARSRSTQNPTSGVYSFGWDLDDGKLSVKFTAAPEELGRRFRQFVFGTTTVHYQVTATSPTEFSMVDTTRGVTYRYTLVEDKALEAAP